MVVPQRVHDGDNLARPFGAFGGKGGGAHSRDVAHETRDEVRAAFAANLFPGRIAALEARLMERDATGFLVTEGGIGEFDVVEGVGEAVMRLTDAAGAVVFLGDEGGLPAREGRAACTAPLVDFTKGLVRQGGAATGGVTLASWGASPPRGASPPHTPRSIGEVGGVVLWGAFASHTPSGGVAPRWVMLHGRRPRHLSVIQARIRGAARGGLEK